MKISAIGCGYLSAVHAAAMASIGNEGIGGDMDTRKVASDFGGMAAFFAPGPSSRPGGMNSLATNVNESAGVGVRSSEDVMGRATVRMHL